jgi:hypothetical protein
VEAEIVSVLKTDKSAEAAQFAEIVRGKIAEVRAARWKALTALAEGEPIAAHHEARVFLDSFPKAPEAAEAKAILAKYENHPKLRRETEAETAYQTALVPVLRRATTATALQSAKPLLDAYQQKYGDTQFAKVVTEAEEHRKAFEHW